MHGRACQHSCEPIQHRAWTVAADQWYVGPTDVLRGPAIKEQPESMAMDSGCSLTHDASIRAAASPLVVRHRI